MRHLAIAAVVALIFAGCGQAAAPSPTGPVATSEPSATPTPSPTPGCPTASPMSVDQYLAADASCFGSRDVTIAGWEDAYASNLSTPPIAPAWLVERASSVLESQLPPTPCDETLAACPWIDVHIDPATDATFDRDGVWVVVTGHRDDPTAETCHYVPLGPDEIYVGSSPDPAPSPDVIRATCRNSFVLTSVTVSAPPAGALAFCPADPVLTVNAYQATDPACFHGKTVRIVAWVGEIPAMDFDGPSIEPSWLEYPARVLWSVPPVVTDGNGSCPDGSEAGPGTCALMFATLDPNAGVAGPEWHHWVIVTGHIDDPAAETCHYTDGGIGGGEIPAAEYARQSCRTAFVITTVEYTTAPIASP